jgi:hypothetical protein
MKSNEKERERVLKGGSSRERQLPESNEFMNK